MAKTDLYIVVHDVIGAGDRETPATKLKGELVTLADFPAERTLDRLIALGAIRKATPEDKQTPAPNPENPALATGQPSGTPEAPKNPPAEHPGPGEPGANESPAAP